MYFPGAQMFAGFDLGGKCGYALLDFEGAIIVRGTWQFGKRTPESASLYFDRITNLIETHLPLVIGYEKVMQWHRSMIAATAYGGYEFILWALSHRYSIPLQLVSVQAIKKIATGFGNAEKKEVMAAAYSRWKVVPDDDNQADALFIAEAVRVAHASHTVRP